MGIKRKVIRVRPHPISVHNEARRLWSEGFLSQVEIGRILGIHNSTVSKTVRGVVKGSLKQN
jgi:predicted transcriptional regulator